MRTTTRDQRRQMKRESAAYPMMLQEIPREDWPEPLRESKVLQRVWRSRDFLVQQFDAENPTARCRLSVCRTQLLNGTNWADGITWDELQDLKAQAGYGFDYAVEVFPSIIDVVNVANMRHLWILAEAPAFAWRRNTGSPR